MRILVTSFALAFLLGTTGLASAQQVDYLSQGRAVARAYAGATHNGVASNGRCGGISYGTGARSCGTATGGPVGGLESRN